MNTALATPLTLPNGIIFDNRFVVAPMTTWSSHEDGTIHEDELRYIARRAAGFGAFITAACSVIPEGKGFSGQWSCDSDAMLPSLASAAEAIHAAGSKAILQLHHGGRMSPASLLGHAPLCPSAIPPARPGADIPREMTPDEIDATITAFGAGARRALAAGYDGVELHGANTYLIQQFFSPHSNRREDWWGGSLEARLRFPLTCVAAVQDAVRSSGTPFVVGYRLSPEEIEEPGISIDDTLVLADALAAEGVDYIHVSTRQYSDGLLRPLPVEERLECMKSMHVFDRPPLGDPATRPTKRIVDHLAGRVPVIGVGHVVTSKDALFIRNDGCELVGVGRSLLTEPDWLTKIRDGRENEIRTTLPPEGGDVELSLPGPMYKRLIAVKGWVSVKGER